MRRKIISYKGLGIPIRKVKKSYREGSIRWLVLFLSQLLMIGDIYAFDIPQTLQIPIENTFQVNTIQYNLLYSFTSLPNIILPFFTGIKMSILICSLFLIIGQIIQIYSVLQLNFYLLVIGRFIFGLGTDSLEVAQNIFICTWFKNNEISIALGLNISSPRLGSILTSFLSNRLYLNYGIFYSFLGGLIAIFILFIIAIVIILIEIQGEQKEKSQKKLYKFKFMDIKQLQISFWILILMSALCESLILIFINNGVKLYQLKFDFSQTQANLLIMIPYLLSQFLTPFFGYLIDKFGKRDLFIKSTCFIFIISHTIFLILPYSNQNYSIFVLILYGICIACYQSSIVTAIPLSIVNQDYYSLAFGIVILTQNIFLTILPIFYGYISGDQLNPQFQNCSIFFLLISILLLILYFLLKIYDPSLSKKIQQKQQKNNYIESDLDKQIYLYTI